MVKTEEYPVFTKKHLALIAPLDWGLGHTTRCIPIIRELVKNNFDIVIACNSTQQTILQPEFPLAQFTGLDGYNLNYGNSGFRTILKLVLQLPKILISIKREFSKITEIIGEFAPDIIISDNRYGVFSTAIPSVFITHQLNINTGTGLLNNKLCNIITHSMIKKFSECWVPDFENGFTLAGNLSHLSSRAPFRVRYIGALSRMDICSTDIRKQYVLVILSGPEPQRTKLEAILIRQLTAGKHEAIIVRGVLHADSMPIVANNIHLINYASAVELNRLICEARVVVSRSGYTSIMDLVKLQKKCVLIPTPGQGEQNYLARFMARQQLAIIGHQHNLNLEQCIADVDGIRIPEELNMDYYKTAMVQSLKDLGLI